MMGLLFNQTKNSHFYFNNMKIIIDCRVFTKRATGIATYTIDAIRAISSYIPEWHLILVSPKQFHESIIGLPKDKIDIIISPMFGIEKIPNIIWFQIHLPKIVKKLNADILWSPLPETPILSIGKAKRMITIHDVVGKEFKYTMSWKNKIFYLFPFSDLSINKADYIWCNSNYTYKKLNEYYPYRKQMQSIIGDSCNTRFKKIEISKIEQKQIYKEYNIKKGFILFVGTLEPRKNLSFLLEIMPAIYKNTGYKLLVVGASGWKNSNITKIINSPEYNKDAVIFAQYVEVDKLVKLYNLAQLYISTALNEGFGMPQLEAMSCGCPVVSPHNSAMIEVVSTRGLTIEGWEHENWIKQVCELLTSPERLKSMSNPDISEYNWKNIILQLKHYIES